jgi:hypothetical protein
MSGSGVVTTCISVALSTAGKPGFGAKVTIHVYSPGAVWITADAAVTGTPLAETGCIPEIPSPTIAPFGSVKVKVNVPGDIPMTPLRVAISDKMPMVLVVFVMILGSTVSALALGAPMAANSISEGMIHKGFRIRCLL